MKQTREKRKGLTPLTNAERAKRNADSFMGRINRLVIGARASAKQKGYVFQITREDLLKIWEKQKGKCAYTNWPLSTKTNDKNLVSIDRINSDIGYIPENIQLTCWSVNRAKSFMDEKDFQEMCDAVVKNQYKSTT